MTGNFLSGSGTTKVFVRQDGPVAELVLNRPEVMNALDPEAIEMLTQAVATVAANPEIRALVVRGEGGAFCAGADLLAVSDLVRDTATFDRFLTDWNAAFDALAALPVPTVAAVHGLALAGGFELTHTCDQVIVGESARLGDQHANYGMFPAGGGIQRLGRLVGPRRASWLLMSGNRLLPEVALEWGLALEVCLDDEVVIRAFEVARALATKSSGLNAAIKDGLRTGLDISFEQAMAHERDVAVAHMVSPDARAGLQAFGSRETPQFGPRAIPSTNDEHG